MLYPDHFEQKIAFTTIRQLLKDKCVSTLGEEKVDEIQFSSDYADVMRLLSQTDEMLRVLTTNADELPIGDFYDVRPALSRIRVEGLFLDELEVFDLRRALEAVRLLVAFLTKHEAEVYPHLHELVSEVETFPLIVNRIDAILNKFGKIKDNASPELARIRKDIFQVQSGISRTLNSILRQAQADGYVEKDVAPTMREGRLVIPVSPAFKRKVNGIVHDESATGKTVFIEPQQVVEANNRVRELEGEERREVMRILVDFTNFVRPYTESIFSSQYFLGQIDFLRAKALFGLDIKAIKPRVDDCCQLEWAKAIHPLLFLSLKKQGKEIVPLDITLNEKQRILLISGPNAGGKSVCLKTVVLLQYMLQCGLLVPLHDSSRAGIYERLFIDIGDEQSIENDLSTYSSHLLNMKFFIKNSNPKTLLLIDEFGTGTEPMIGGAIAEATLERFNQNLAFGVITTHYTNLKHYAEDAEGIVNGAMLYDRQHLQPLFQLSIGNPGSSFAVEIARKIGLPEDLIAEAAEKVGAEHLDYDKHLQDIVRDKRYWENKRQQIRQKEKRLEETLAKYEEEMAGIDKQRKEITNKAKDEAKNLLNEANAKIENTIRQIKEAEAEKVRTQAVRKELDDFKKKIGNEPETGRDRSRPVQIPKPIHKDRSRPVPTSNAEHETLKIGSNVRMKGQTATGTIIEMQDKQALVAFGNLKSTVKLNQLEAISNNQLKKEARKYESLGSTATDEVRQRKLTFQSEIDVRGMRGDEALQAVMYFIDDAVMVGVASVRILHGTGTGALRQMIRQYLGTTHGIRTYRDEHIQFGGAGVTVVEFE
ncbi:Smr protein/MutS2 [Paludibacter propionicigenes WB4]|uniref:Endonuclease MutS2 n=1 Tax=Paludibacter propionicigenes (strain DSM 17365 / JCM 13257 / WB4) TaxID=694427 RepID=E4T3A4_PALPW|nr:endonuclease MutS2 [Paludibacter propionicigenes]ADQ79198.1 Smr protein/MutS2 [Paludibacter propionicigenes WB4]